MGPKTDKGGWCCKRIRCARLCSLSTIKPDVKFVAPMDRNCIKLNIEQSSAKCLVDSGAAFCCISKYLLKRVKPNAVIQRSSVFSGVGVCGEIHQVLGEVELELTFGNHKVKQIFKIFETLHAKVILGLDFLRAHDVITDFGQMTLTIPETKFSNNGNSFGNIHFVTVPTYIENSAQRILPARTCSEVVIQPHSETILPLRIDNIKDGSTVLLEPKAELSNKYCLAGAKTVSKISSGVVH